MSLCGIAPQIESLLGMGELLNLRIARHCKCNIEVAQQLVELAESRDGDALQKFLDSMALRFRGGKIRGAKHLDICIRDQFKCVYCGSTLNLTLDHVIPLLYGGTKRKDNLVLCCTDCNLKKGHECRDEFEMKRAIGYDGTPQSTSLTAALGDMIKMRQ